MIKKLFSFIDDSGSDHFPRNENNVYFSLCNVLIDSSEVNEIQENFDRFKKRYSERLQSNIGYLHDREIEDGYIRGIGKYTQLKFDSLLNEKFFEELATLLRKSNYKIISIVFNLKTYQEYLFSLINKYYESRGEKITSISNNNKSIFFITTLFQFIFLYRQEFIKQYEDIEIGIEEKLTFTDMDENFLNALTTTLFKDKKITFYPSISKTSNKYHVGYELADLCANSLRKKIEDPERRIMEYEIIKDKVILNQELSVEDYLNTIKFAK